MNEDKKQNSGLLWKMITTPLGRIIEVFLLILVTWGIEYFFKEKTGQFYSFSLFLALIVFIWLAVSHILSMKRNEDETKRHNLTYEEQIKSLRVAFQNTRHGFIPLDQKERITRIIAALSGNNPCKKISVIGKTLDYLEEKELKSYLDSYVERMEKNQPFEYRRITSRQISKDGYLYKHYIDLLDRNSNDKEFSILLMNEFTIANTYIIIDDQELIVSLHITKENNNNAKNVSLPGEIMEMKASFLCLDKTIIADYQAHFDIIYNSDKNKDNVCRTKNEFIEQIAANANKDKLREINKNMKGIISGSLEEVYFSIRLHELEQQFLSIQQKHKLTIDHTNSNGSIIKAFCVCLDNLRQGDEYFTVSHSGFWQSVLQPNRMVRTIDFVQSTLNALEKGASMQRLFLLQPSKIESWLKYIKEPNNVIQQDRVADFNEYNQFINIVSQNMKFYRIAHSKNTFRFGILFREDSGSGDFSTFNHALILRQNPNEYVAFLPDKEIQNKNDSSYSIYRTSVLFLNRKVKEQEMQETFNGKIAQMNKLIQEYNFQRSNRTQDEKDFFYELQNYFISQGKYIELFEQKKLDEWVLQTELLPHPPLENF
ncbi:MAG: hypothetical protein MUC87_06905 [Bacteroidia bacterium]|jgi:hypothetical protein|nr:hypothetical protein [Bacteroidia bacterium]